MNKKIVAAIAASLMVSSIPVACLACCKYDAEKDAYVCGGGDVKDGTVTNGGGCGGEQVSNSAKSAEEN